MSVLLKTDDFTQLKNHAQRAYDEANEAWKYLSRRVEILADTHLSKATSEKAKKAFHAIPWIAVGLLSPQFLLLPLIAFSALHTNHACQNGIGLSCAIKASVSLMAPTNPLLLAIQILASAYLMNRGRLVRLSK